jgi:hypothetical protein
MQPDGMARGGLIRYRHSSRVRRPRLG